MTQVKIYTQEGKEAGQLALNDAHFGVKVQPGLLHEVVVAQQANARHPISNTKTKGEVRGGGKKPWKQKGTGRARQGSTRNPHWVGGGVAFGPTSERNYSVKVNRKARQKALFMALSDKVASEHLFVLETFVSPENKTKHVATLLATLPIPRKALLVIPKSDPQLLRMVRNIQRVKLVTVNSINVADVVQYPTIVFWKDAVPVFETLYHNAK